MTVLMSLNISAHVFNTSWTCIWYSSSMNTYTEFSHCADHNLPLAPCLNYPLVMAIATEVSIAQIVH